MGKPPGHSGNCSANLPDLLGRKMNRVVYPGRDDTLTRKNVPKERSIWTLQAPVDNTTNRGAPCCIRVDANYVPSWDSSSVKGFLRSTQRAF